MRECVSGWVTHSLVLEGLEQLFSPRSTYVFHLSCANGTLWSSQCYLFYESGAWISRDRCYYNASEDLRVLSVSAVNVTTIKNLAHLASWRFKTIRTLASLRLRVLAFP